MRRAPKAESIPCVRIKDGETVLPKLAFRVDELVHVLGLGKTKIRELIDRGKLGHIREGSAVLVTIGQLKAYIGQKESAAGF